VARQFPVFIDDIDDDELLRLMTDETRTLLRYDEPVLVIVLRIIPGVV